jgi:hypothetical protein
VLAIADFFFRGRQGNLFTHFIAFITSRNTVGERREPKPLLMSSSNKIAYYHQSK